MNFGLLNEISCPIHCLLFCFILVLAPKTAKFRIIHFNTVSTKWKLYFRFCSDTNELEPWESCFLYSIRWSLYLLQCSCWCSRVWILSSFNNILGAIVLTKSAILYYCNTNHTLIRWNKNLICCVFFLFILSFSLSLFISFWSIFRLYILTANIVDTAARRFYARININQHSNLFCCWYLSCGCWFRSSRFCCVFGMLDRIQCVLAFNNLEIEMIV